MEHPGGARHYEGGTISGGIMFVQVSTDNQIVTDAGANARLEERIREKLKRFEKRLTHVEVHVADANGAKGGDGDKRVSLEARANGHAPVAVHAEAARIDTAVTAAADKALRALDHALGKLQNH
jgi:ribosome-associated translation inhibitor RaiA